MTAPDERTAAGLADPVSAEAGDASAPTEDATTTEAATSGDATAEDATSDRPDDAIVLHITDFEGPLDLLLSLIEREDLDITAVSLVEVTEQYLKQLRSAESINLAALADFVAVGARLLLLKSRALLPREAVDDEDSEEDETDPEALVAALQEYRRFKRAADHLRGLEEEHRTVYRREAPPPEVPLPTGLDGVSLDSLVELFREVLERLPEEEERPAVQRDPVRLRDRIQRLVSRLEGQNHVSFRELISEARSRIEVVVDFMAVLELIKARYLEASQSSAFGDIELVRTTEAPSAAEVEAELSGEFDLE
ncbi:MAG: segregation/condensation protein A [Dehalococcoidia bacterium]